MKRILLLIPLIFLYSGGYIGSKPKELSDYIAKCDWGGAFSYIGSNSNIPFKYINYIKMRYYENIDNMDSALYYAKTIEKQSDSSMIYDILRVFNKTGNDSLILEYADSQNDSLVKLFYFMRHNNRDSIVRYIGILPDTSFYTVYSLIARGKNNSHFDNEIKKFNYDTRAYIYEQVSMYRKAIGIRKKIMHFRGAANLYSLATDYYLTGDKSRAYYYYKRILSVFPTSKYALKSVKMLKKRRKIHGKLRYIAAEVFINSGWYRSALSILRPLSRHSSKTNTLRAICYYHLRRYGRTIRLLWHKRKNKNGEASFFIGLSYYKLNKFEKSKRFLKYYIEQCHNDDKYVGESYYRLAQMYENKLFYYKKALEYDVPSYFTERAMYAVYKTGDVNLFQDIINQFISRIDNLTPKMAYVLVKMAEDTNNRGLTVYYKEYMKSKFPVDYYTIESDSSVLNNFQPVEVDSLLYPLKTGVILGYGREVKEIIRHSRSDRFYLQLAKYAWETGNYPLSINWANRYLKYCLKTGKAVNDSLYYFLFPRGYESLVKKASVKYGIDESLIYAIIREESWFQKRARSRVGARGLMQVMPSTFRHLKRYEKSKYFEPDYNIDAGAYYISLLKKKYDGYFPPVIAHYNGGSFPANVSDTTDFVEHIPYVETEKYVKNVLRSYEFYKKLYNSN